MADTDPGWSCDRCGHPVVQVGDSNWQHADSAQGVFCSLVWGAADRLKGGGDAA